MYDVKSNFNNFDPTLKNCLFGPIKPTKNSDIDKYEHAGYGIRFDSKETFSHPSGGTGVNVVIFGADMSFSVHANNRLEDTTLCAIKKCILLILLQPEKKSVYVCIIMEIIVICLSMAQRLLNLKQMIQKL